MWQHVYVVCFAREKVFCRQFPEAASAVVRQRKRGECLPVCFHLRDVCIEKRDTHAKKQKQLKPYSASLADPKLDFWTSFQAAKHQQSPTP